MPPVVPFLLQVAMSTVSLVAGTSVAMGLSAGAALAIGAAVVVGGALVAYKAMSLFEVDIPTVDTDASRQRTVKSTTEPQKIIYGQALVSGPISFIALAGTDNQDLYQTVVLAGHKLNNITDIHMDDLVIPNADIGSGDAAGGQVGGSGPFGLKNSAAICTFNKHLGAASQTADSLLTPLPNYTTSHRGDGIAYLAMKWTLNEHSAKTWEKYSPQNVKALVQGKSIYDPRLDVTAGNDAGANPTNASYITYSTNPALCLADYLMDATLGMGISAAKINWAAIITAANGCDVSVSVPGGTEARFSCNGVIFATDKHQKNINKILSSMNGNLVYSNGKYILHAGIYEAPTESLNEDDLIGAISIKTSLERSDRFNTIKGLFVDPSQNHKSSEFPKVQLADAVTRDNGEVLEKEVQYPMTNSSYGAQRLSHKLIQLSDQQKIITFPANLSALRIAAGDRVQVSVEELSWTNKVFQCVDWTFSEQGGVNLTLREDSSTSYADPTVAPTNEYSTITASGSITDAFRGVPSPSGLRAASGEGKVFLNWVNPGRPADYATIEVFSSSTNNVNNAVKIGDTDGTQFVHDGNNAADSIAVGNTRRYWIRSKKNVGTTVSEVSVYEPNSTTSSVTLTVLATAVNWDNVANPTIGVDINSDTISINTGSATTTTGQAVANSGLNSGGLTMNTGGSIKGGQSAYNSGTGFFLGYDSGYKFSIGNSSSQALTFDGSNLSVTGNITATSGTFTGTVNASAGAFTGDVSTGSKFTAGSSNDIAVMDGGNALYRFYAGNSVPESAAFRVDKDGHIDAANIRVYDENGQVILDATGLHGVGLGNISANSGVGVSEVAGRLDNNADEITFTTGASSETYTFEPKVQIDINQTGESGENPNTSNLSFAAASESAVTTMIGQVKLIVEYFVKASGGSYSGTPTATEEFTFVSGTSANSSQFGVNVLTINSRGVGIIYADIGASEAISDPSIAGARTFVRSSKNLTFSSAGTYNVKVNARIATLAGTTLTTSTTPALDSSSSGTGVILGTDETQSSLEDFRRLYAIKPASGNTRTIIASSTDDTFVSTSGSSLLNTGGTISGDLVITGDLTVQGTTTTINVADLTVADKDITLNYSTGDSSSTANNAGIIIQDAVNSTTDATLLWKTATDTFEFSHPIKAQSDLTLSSAGGDAGIYWKDSSASDATAWHLHADVTQATTNLLLNYAGGGTNFSFVNNGNFLAPGTIFADGAASNSLQWEAGYDYSQVGHLPLSGGTLTGGLTAPSLNVDNITIDGNDISTTNSNGNLNITPNGTGNVNINSDTVAITAAENESASLVLASDEADDNPDLWRFRNNTDNTLTIGNQISGSNVDHITITPNATVTNSIAAFAGKITAAGNATFTGTVTGGNGTFSNLTIGATEKLRFDGSGGHTFIQESSNDTLTFATGGSTRLALDANATFSGSVSSTGFRFGNTSVGTEDDNEYLMSTGGQLIIRANDSAADDSYAYLILDSGNASGASSASAGVMTRTNGVERLRVGGDGTIKFFEDTGTTAKLHWDASLTSLKLTGAEASRGNNTYAFEVDNSFQTSNMTAAGALRVKNYYGDSLVVNAIGDVSFFDDSGSAKFFWDASTERLGLGVTNPATDLHIKNAGSTQLLLESGNTDKGFLLFGDAQDLNIGSISYNHSDNSMSFETDDATRLTINADGSSVFSGSVTSTGLDVTGTATVDGLVVGGSATGTITLGDAGYNGIIQAPHTITLDAQGAGESVVIKTQSTERMRIDGASGNVGIGASSPSTYDSRANNLVVGDSGDSGITIFSGASSDARIQFAPSGSTGLDNGLIGYDNATDKMVFATGGSDRVAIDSSGNVGIGTVVAPANKLNIQVGTDTRVGFWGSSSYGAMQVTNDANSVLKPMRFDASEYQFIGGNVGIGQSNPTSPNDATDFLHIGSATNQDTSIVLQDAVETWEIYQNDDLSFLFDTTNVMTLQRLTGNVNIPNGSLMVGATTAPTGKLDVEWSINSPTGGVYLKNNSTGTGAYTGIYYGNNVSDTDAFVGLLGGNNTAYYGGARSFVLGTNASTPVALMTGGTERMRIMPDGAVVINPLNGDGQIYFNGTSGNLTMFLAKSGLETLLWNRGNGAMRFGTNDSERARLTSDGALLVGTTSTSIATTSTETGTQITDGGISIAANNPVAQFNRISSDGAIVNLRKDGSTIGSLGTVSTYLTIGKNDTGLLFMDASDYIEPFNLSTNAARDAAIDLGRSGARFKDLYLSGNTQMGGNLDVVGQIGAYNNPSSSWGQMILRATDFVFKNAGGSTRASLDTSGNLLVGKTSSGVSTVGAELRNGSSNYAVTGTSSSHTVALFNRTSSDGEILQFRKDNTTVGSLGANSGQMYVSGPTAGGLKFSYSDSTHAVIYPVTTSGAVADNLHDLGYANARFRDLYLSSNLKVGGSSSFQFQKSGTHGYINQSDSGDLIFRMGSGFSERARITSDGKFGLGTSAPQKYLHMQHGSTNAFTPSNDSWHSVIVHNNASAATNTAGIAFEVSGSAYHGNAGTGIAAVKNGTASDYGADLVFITRPQSAVAEERLRISSTGNLGISVAPSAFVLPDGSTGALQLQSGGMVSAYNGVTHLSQNWYFNSGEKYIANGSASRLVMQGADYIWQSAGNNTSGAGAALTWSESMRLSGGNLLVGCTSAPTGSTGGSAFITESVGRKTLKIASTTTGGAGHIELINPNGIVGTIVTSGSATSYNTSSDQRLKDKIVDAPSASDDIDAIQVRSFDWKADGSHQKYGMIAQELIEVAPEAVSAPEDPEEMMGVDYSKLVPMLIKEIQQLRKRVKDLEE